MDEEVGSCEIRFDDVPQDRAAAYGTRDGGLLTYVAIRPDVSIHVAHADPYTWAATEFLARIAAGECHRAITLARDPRGCAAWATDLRCRSGCPTECFRDSILRIEGSNRTVVYKVGAYLEDKDAWELRWPD